MERQLRADARRNRVALLEAAREALIGGEPDIGVEEIAQRAGVAVGTLYRHFDTREALVEHVFRQELNDLCESAGGVGSGPGPSAPLRPAATQRGLVARRAPAATAAPHHAR